ncbi:MAG: hypothetical protein GKR93_03840 [Gammaproteobacteria bacterium]|nr:hypothetical protein [Gammaproteobacteria bacterium]
MGLVSALESLHSIASHNVTVPLSTNNYFSAVLGIPPVFKDLPAPDLLLGAGHATHLPMLMARLRCGGSIAALMRPSIPQMFFDYCLIPEHDNSVANDKIILTKGPINRIRPVTEKSNGKGLVLIGGPSKHFHWDTQSLETQLREIIVDKRTHWTICDSPRTPADTRQLLRSLSTDSVHYEAFSKSRESGITGLIEKATSIWVSEDSMSMIYEALTSGAGVGILRVPGRDNNKLSNVAKTLAADQSLQLFEEWIKQKKLYPARQAIFESERCAKELIRRLDWSED